MYLFAYLGHHSFEQRVGGCEGQDQGHREDLGSGAVVRVGEEGSGGEEAG